MTTLEELAKQVADDQAAIDSESDDVRTRVLRMGKYLRKIQKEQKKEQAETGLTWKDWCEEQKVASGNFPNPVQCSRYMLISRYPRAYKSGMSIKEAYRHAGLWKKNGGKPPLEKKTIKARPLITIGAMAGRLERKMEALSELDFAETAAEQGWTEDEILGAVDVLTLTKQSCNFLLRKLKELQEQLS